MHAILMNEQTNAETKRQTPPFHLYDFGMQFQMMYSRYMII